MSSFKSFKDAIRNKFNELVSANAVLYLTAVEKDALWEMYLDSFPPGTNEIFRERREYDCQCCRQFIRPYGNVVAIVGNELVSIWDIEIDDPKYQTVANAMSQFVKSQAVRDIFVSKFAKLGTDKNQQQLESGEIHTWHHFYMELPQTHVDKSGYSVESLQGHARDTKNVFMRSLKEISMEAIDTVLELIAQKSLYRGEEQKGLLLQFKQFMKEFEQVPAEEQDNYCWVTSPTAGAVSRIRNNAIGTLLIDISEGKELDYAVRAFEKIMAPANYKRPKPIMTKKMIENAEKKVKELGLESSLGRRYAVVEDVTVNNVLFANRDAKAAMSGSVFDEMKEEVKVDPKKLSKVEEISIEDFVKDVLPSTTSIEMLMENKHTGNLMSVIAPKDTDAPSLFKWDNGFSWAYNGDLADSIKERVKAAGGKVDGIIRVSLSWYNHDDLDLHVIEPNGNKIYYSNKSSRTSGRLDVDMNAGGRMSRNAVENITWTNRARMLTGEYKVIVNNYTKRETNDIGFEVEIEYEGEIHHFAYSVDMRSGENVQVASFTFDQNELNITKSIPSSIASKQVWNVETNSFQKVSLMMHSPNHWDEQGVGNRHYFFVLDGCKNDGQPRGFFNEFLKEELMEDKRVFEALGSKMKVEESERQLSGLGFSSTQKNSVVCKVTGSMTRTLKINF